MHMRIEVFQPVHTLMNSRTQFSGNFRMRIQFQFFVSQRVKRSLVFCRARNFHHRQYHVLCYYITGNALFKYTFNLLRYVGNVTRGGGPYNSFDRNFFPKSFGCKPNHHILLNLFQTCLPLIDSTKCFPVTEPAFTVQCLLKFFQNAINPILNFSFCLAIFLSEYGKILFFSRL